MHLSFGLCRILSNRVKQFNDKPYHISKDQLNLVTQSEVTYFKDVIPLNVGIFSEVVHSEEG